MHPIVLVKGAWNALLKNKKRSILTMIGIVIGIAAVSTIISIGRGFEQFVLDSLNPDEGELLTVDIQFQADDIEWMYETNEAMFSDMDIRMVQSLPSVNQAEIPSMDWESISMELAIREETEYITASLVDDHGRQTVAGRSLDQLDNEMGSRMAVLPMSLAERFSNTGNIEDTVGLGISLDGQLYTVVGVYEEIEELSGVFDSFFIMDEVEIPRESYGQYNDDSFFSDQLSVTVNQGYLPSEVADEVVSLMEEEGSMSARGEYTHWDMSEIDDGISQVLRGITLFIASIAGISLFIAGIGVMNMMYISVSERTKEIGIRRALGASQKSIRAQFVLEGVMMTSVGGIFGYLFGLLFASIASAFLPFSVGIDFFTVAVALGVSALIGLIFSYAPANAAGKKEIIEIL